MFYDCKNMLSIDLSNFNTDKVTNMEGTVYGCSNLKEIEGLKYLISNNVINMQIMFYECNNLISINLSKFHTDKVNIPSFTTVWRECFMDVQI